MNNQPDNKEFEDLEQVNAELKASLEKCRTLLRECRDNLAANSNETDEQERPPAQRNG